MTWMVRLTVGLGLLVLCAHCGGGGGLDIDLQEKETFVSGRVTTPDGAGVAGIRVNVSYNAIQGPHGLYSTLTDSGGYYSVTINQSFSDTITISIHPEQTRESDGAEFLTSPILIDVRQGANLTNQNLNVTPAVVVSGRVTTTTGVGVERISVRLDEGRSISPDYRGYYSIRELKNKPLSLVLTPVADFLITDPVSRTVLLQGENVVGQDFTASCRSSEQHLVTGRVAFEEGSPQFNVEIGFSGPQNFSVFANGDGEFVSNCLVAGEYVISPVQTAVISPLFRTVVVGDADIGNQDFVIQAR